MHSTPSRLQGYSFAVEIDSRCLTVRYMQYLGQTNGKGKQRIKKSQGLDLGNVRIPIYQYSNISVGIK